MTNLSEFIQSAALYIGNETDFLYAVEARRNTEVSGYSSATMSN